MEMGFRVNPSSRVMQQHNTLVNNIADIAFGTDEFFIAVEALRDLQMLGFVFDQVNDVEDPIFRELIKKCLSDPTLREEGRDNTPGRDAQFELFVAAVSKRASSLLNNS
ncbi:MAG TPA: hypothetical protein VGJ05_00715 [Fimbriiglobus sp.]